MIFFKADYLADRIAILSKGSLRCFGSPLFLKSKYSSGYSLVLTRKHPAFLENNLNGNNDFLTDKITSLVKRLIPGSILQSNINSEIAFLLSSQNTNKYSILLDELENSKEELGIINIGLSSTTVEQVFLKYKKIIN